ncbi:MAG: hypothetical protein HDR54_05035 [Treponema sp.]|nr:hypothetical protein [Treponema sp.]
MMMKHYILQAVNGEGKSVYIDDVPNGKKCGCLCAECHGALIAKQGNIKAHHFAHASGNDSIKCSQTALHLLAKEIVAEEKRIPAFVDGNIAFVTVDSVEQEKNMGDIKPDLYAEYNGKPVAIEIFVSHAVDDEKFTKIQHHRLTTFEINLSELIFETREEVKQAIYDVKNVHPIYDEQFTEKALVDKKHFIDTNGTIKIVHNGIVSECPMHLELRGRQAVLSPVDSNLCRKCPFGYKIENEDVVHCIGHLNIELSKSIFLSRLRGQNITVYLDYSWQVNVSEYKVVSLAEIADFLTCVTKQKFSVIKPKKKNAARQRI